MSESHTPGPWVAERIGDMFDIYVDADDDGEPITYNASAANARLIAAAPDLLSALRRLHHSYRLLASGRPVRDMTETLAEVDAAFIKATGEVA